MFLLLLYSNKIIASMFIRKLLTVILLLSATTVFGASSVVRFSLLGESGIMCRAKVNCMYQDSLGYVWLGTNQGLVRYDGHVAKTFNRMCYPCLPSNTVREMAVGADGRLWLNTSGGLMVFDVENEMFRGVDVVYNGHKLKNIHGLKVSKSGDLMFLSAGDLYLYNHLKRKCTIINTFLPDYPQKKPSLFYVDSNSDLWIGYPNVGIAIYDRMKKKPVLKVAFPYTPIIIKDYQLGSMLLGSLNRGLFIIDKNNGEIRKLENPDKSAKEIFASDFCALKNGDVWVSTWDGIYVVSSGRITARYCHNDADMMSLPSDNVGPLLLDKDGNIWIGFVNGGTAMCSYGSNVIEKYYPSPVYPSMRSGGYTAFASDGKGGVWIGSDNSGIYHLGSDCRVRSLTEVCGLRLNCNVVTDLLVADGKLYVATYSGGINVIDIGRRSLEVFYKDGTKGCLTNNEDNCICLDSEGTLWLGTTTGVFSKRKDEREFRHVKGVDDWVNDIVADRNGLIWIATREQGLACYNKKKRSLRWLQHNARAGNLVPIGALNSIMTDNDGRIWIATEEEGVCRIDVETGRTDIVSLSDGLPSNSVCKLLPDREGNVWASTSNGIARIDAKTMSVLTVVSNSNWILSPVFCNNSGMVSDEGLVFFGNVRGFVSFVPDMLNGLSAVRKPMVTELKVSFAGTDSMLTRRDLKESMRLPYDTRNVMVRLSAMEQDVANSGRYQYMLSGLDDRWNDCGEVPVVHLRNLHPGSYTLYARFFALSGWSDKTEVLRFTILPPWWQTWTAYAVYAILVLCIAVVLARRMRAVQDRKLIRKQQEWERQKTMEETARRIDFFTSVAHEIRTPLTVVKEIADNTDTDNALVPDLPVLRRNVNNLMKLVNRLLEFRRVEAGIALRNMEQIDVKEYIMMVLSSFEPIINNRHIDCSCSMPPKRGTVFINAEAQSFVTVLNNVIGNALKYCDKWVRIEVTGKAGMCCITISNDGATVPENVRKQLFVPFVKGNNQTQSTGLGLSMVKILVEQMRGNVRLSKCEPYTSFVLDFPLASLDTTEQAPIAGTEVEAENSSLNVLLIVEDNDDMRELLRKEFAKEYVAVAVSDGLQAWHYLLDNEVDCVVSDVMMPNMDGLTLCRCVKDNLNTAHIPVLLLTARTLVQDRLDGYGAGADGYVDKPFLFSELKAMVDSLIANRKRIRNVCDRVIAGNVVADMENADGSVNMQNQASAGLGAGEKAFMEKLNYLIETGISEEGFNIDVLAKRLNMSRSSFHRKVSSLLKMTPGEYVMHRRMELAARLLLSKQYRIGEVAERIGFSSQAHFSRCFQKYYGKSPSAFANIADSSNL